MLGLVPSAVDLEDLPDKYNLLLDVLRGLPPASTDLERLRGSYVHARNLPDRMA